MRFSIVIVCFNAGEKLNQTVENVLCQSMTDYEIVIKDGMSTDGSVEAAAELIKSRGAAERLKLIREKDAGIYDAMNRGIDEATGEIIGMINADDWYEPEALCVVNKTMEQTPFDLFYADLRMWIDENRSFIKHARNRRYATSRDWNHPTTFITREMYQKYRYKNETIHDDYDLILRMKKDGVRIVVVNEVLADFRMNGVSHERKISSALKRAKIKYEIYRRNGYSPFYLIECYGVELAKLIIG